VTSTTILFSHKKSKRTLILFRLLHNLPPFSSAIAYGLSVITNPKMLDEWSPAIHTSRTANRAVIENIGISKNRMYEISFLKDFNLSRMMPSSSLVLGSERVREYAGGIWRSIANFLSSAGSFGSAQIWYLIERKNQ
jgi:hypothetical protein